MPGLPWMIGLMSGTSMDGIDAALLRTDGSEVGEFGPAVTVPYGDSLRQQIRTSLGGQPAPGLGAAITLAHAEVVQTLLRESGLRPADVCLLGFHGHTLLHRPDRGRTWQIGDGQLLARLTGISTVSDFRSQDVALGGQGAPLVPLYHGALARRGRLDLPLMVLNLGGVANLTYIGGHLESDLLAFDTGPGNALLDDWMLRHTGARMDQGGQLAAQGAVDPAILAQMLEHRFFDRPAPKSLDRDDFTCDPVAGLWPAAGAATLTAFTAGAVARALEWLPARPRQCLVTGGGRHNGSLMAELCRWLKMPVAPVESVGWRGDALEAEAFAYLAARAANGLSLSLPGTTGVPQPATGGRIWRI